MKTPSTALVPASEAALPQLIRLTRATNDRQLVDAWLDGLASAHSRRNFAATAARFLEELGRRGYTLQSVIPIEDLRDILVSMSQGRSVATARQYVLRCKSLLSFAHKMGYAPVNPGVAIKAPRADSALAKRIVGELAIQRLIAHSRTQRNRVLLALTYGSGARVSEVAGLNVGDVIARDDGRVQLHILGKGGRVREVLLPKTLGPRVLALCAERPPEAPLFVSNRGRRLGARGIGHVVKRAAKLAGGVPPRISPHWLRHGHASHALKNGADLATVQATLGHANVATTSTYLHAEPGTASGDSLKAEVWEDRAEGE